MIPPTALSTKERTWGSKKTCSPVAHQETAQVSLEHNGGRGNSSMTEASDVGTEIRAGRVCTQIGKRPRMVPCDVIALSEIWREGPLAGKW